MRSSGNQYETVIFPTEYRFKYLFQAVKTKKLLTITIDTTDPQPAPDKGVRFGIPKRGISMPHYYKFENSMFVTVYNENLSDKYLHIYDGYDSIPYALYLKFLYLHQYIIIHSLLDKAETLKFPLPFGTKSSDFFSLRIGFEGERVIDAAEEKIYQLLINTFAIDHGLAHPNLINNAGKFVSLLTASALEIANLLIKEINPENSVGVQRGLELTNQFDYNLKIILDQSINNPIKIREALDTFNMQSDYLVYQLTRKTNFVYTCQDRSVTLLSSFVKIFVNQKITIKYEDKLDDKHSRLTQYVSDNLDEESKNYNTFTDNLINFYSIAFELNADKIMNYWRVIKRDQTSSRVFHTSGQDQAVINFATKHLITTKIDPNRHLMNEKYKKAVLYVTGCNSYYDPEAKDLKLTTVDIDYNRVHNFGTCIHQASKLKISKIYAEPDGLTFSLYMLIPINSIEHKWIKVPHNTPTIKYDFTQYVSGFLPILSPEAHRSLLVQMHNNNRDCAAVKIENFGILVKKRTDLINDLNLTPTEAYCRDLLLTDLREKFLGDKDDIVALFNPEFFITEDRAAQINVNLNTGVVELDEDIIPPGLTSELVMGKSVNDWKMFVEYSTIYTLIRACQIADFVEIGADSKDFSIKVLKTVNYSDLFSFIEMLVQKTNNLFGTKSLFAENVKNLYRTGHLINPHHHHKITRILISIEQGIRINDVEIEYKTVEKHIKNYVDNSTIVHANKESLISTVKTKYDFNVRSSTRVDEMNRCLIFYYKVVSNFTYMISEGKLVDKIGEYINKLKNIHRAIRVPIALEILTRQERAKIEIFANFLNSTVDPTQTITPVKDDTVVDKLTGKDTTNSDIFINNQGLDLEKRAYTKSMEDGINKLRDDFLKILKEYKDEVENTPENLVAKRNQYSSKFSNVQKNFTSFETNIKRSYADLSAKDGTIKQFDFPNLRKIISEEEWKSFIIAAKKHASLSISIGSITMIQPLEPLDSEIKDIITSNNYGINYIRLFSNNLDSTLTESKYNELIQEVEKALKGNVYYKYLSTSPSLKSGDLNRIKYIFLTKILSVVGPVDMRKTFSEFLLNLNESGLKGRTGWFSYLSYNDVNYMNSIFDPLNASLSLPDYIKAFAVSIKGPNEFSKDFEIKQNESSVKLDIEAAYSKDELIKIDKLFNFIKANANIDQNQYSTCPDNFTLIHNDKPYTRKQFNDEYMNLLRGSEVETVDLFKLSLVFKRTCS